MDEHAVRGNRHDLAVGFDRLAPHDFLFVFGHLDHGACFCGLRAHHALAVFTHQPLQAALGHPHTGQRREGLRCSRITGDLHSKPQRMLSRLPAPRMLRQSQLGVQGKKTPLTLVTVQVFPLQAHFPFQMAHPTPPFAFGCHRLTAFHTPLPRHPSLLRLGG